MACGPAGFPSRLLNAVHVPPLAELCQQGVRGITQGMRTDVGLAFSRIR